MKIIKLTASNVKRLRAVEINPDGTLQIVTGRNAQGKSSVLDAIWLALGGGQASRDTPRPIRDGEDHASVTLDLGALTVTRTWDAEKDTTRLVVKAADGAAYRSPQTLLDGLVGKLSFDPLAFTRLKPSEQREALLDLLDLDFADADRERARLYDLRLDTGRKAHAYGDLPKLDKDAPTAETSARAILDRINAATDTRGRIRTIGQQQAANIAEAERLEAQAEDLRTRAGKLRQAAGEMQDVLNSYGLPENRPEDIVALRAELDEVEDRNRVARENRRVLDDTAAQKALQEEYAALGKRIAAIDDSKAAAIKAANMPVDGLGFDDSGVTYNGVPFQQASSAEQIRVSLGMAMALNPSLRVIRILDGSLLDDDSMAAIAAMAEQHDYQVWVERVSDDAESAVVIEDGRTVE